MTLKKQPKTLWVGYKIASILSLGMLSNCANIPKPDTNLCIANVPLSHFTCYNLKNDYDDNGNIKKDSKPTFKDLKSLEDINKNICTDPDGFANLKTYVRLLREELKSCR